MLYEIDHVHIELSSMCNARCPLCPRNFHGYPTNMGYTETNLDLETVQKILPKDILKKLSHILVNGNFGDFVMNPQSVEILQYFVLHTKRDCKIEVHTNGSARDRQFWHSLGKLGVVIQFSIDGLADTNHLYRQDTSFDQIMKNAQAFIDAGGYAIWSMTVFEHNQHQVSEIQALAKKMGFAEVRPRHTVRDQGPVYNRQGQKIHWLVSDWGWPDTVDENFVKTKQQDIYKYTVESIDQKVVQCWAEKNRSVYIAADGHVYPCCWAGHNPQNYRNHTGLSRWNNEIAQYVHNNHAPTVGLESALAWFDTMYTDINTTKTPAVCQYTCKIGNASEPAVTKSVIVVKNGQKIRVLK